MAKFIQKVIKHPGALTEAAKRHGVSKRQEAEKESHSSNPKIRGRGLLGLRFMKGGDLRGGSARVSPRSMKGEGLMGRNSNLRDKSEFKLGRRTG